MHARVGIKRVVYYGSKWRAQSGFVFQWKGVEIVATTRRHVYVRFQVLKREETFVARAGWEASARAASHALFAKTSVSSRGKRHLHVKCIASLFCVTHLNAFIVCCINFQSQSFANGRVMHVRQLSAHI